MRDRKRALMTAVENELESLNEAFRAGEFDASTLDNELENIRPRRYLRNYGLAMRDVHDDVWKAYIVFFHSVSLCKV